MLSVVRVNTTDASLGKRVPFFSNPLRNLTEFLLDYIAIFLFRLQNLEKALVALLKSRLFSTNRAPNKILPILKSSISIISSLF